MKTAAEVKPPVRCSEEPVAGGESSMCTVSISKKSKKRNKRRSKKKKTRGTEEEEDEKKKSNNYQEKRMEEIASKVDEHQKRIEKLMVDDDAAGGRLKKKKKKVVTWRLSQELLEYLRTKEVMGLLATDAPLPLRATKMAGELFDQRLKEEIAAEFHENREFDAHVLYQYRTLGSAEIQEEVSDDDHDVGEDE